MSAGIHHVIGGVIMGQIGITRSTIKGKLQDQHARYIEMFPQSFDFRGDDSQIFGNQR